MKAFTRHGLLTAVIAAGVTLMLGGASGLISAAPSSGISPGVFEAGEDLPGGAATSREGADTRDAFSHPSHGIGLEGESAFKLGNAMFRRLWVSSPSSTTSADGLGPLYNARSCQTCHLRDGRGRPPEPGEDAVSMVLRLSIPPETDAQRARLASGGVAVIAEPTYGTQLQTVAVKGLDAEGQMRMTYADVPVTLGDGTDVKLRKPTYSIADPGYGPLHPKTMMSPRVAPQMIGLGLIEAIPESAIRAHADPDDADHDGISGRVSETLPAQATAPLLGRFGWKAQAASVLEQSAAAASSDIGLSNPLNPDAAGNCTERQAICRKAPNGNSEASGGFELGQELLDLIVFYAQNLAVPARRDANDASVLRGKGLFHAAGCAACHMPRFKTGVVEGQPQLSNQTIWPYTDLLLHDMGEGLADQRPEGSASGSEWRTAPLWGIGLTETVSGHTLFMHDGRARNVEEAILWHGGEGGRAREAYRMLSKAEREALITFVMSL